MNKTYIKRFQRLSEELRNPKLSEYARIENENTFTRKRKMPLNDILLCCLAKKGLTTEFELRKYFKEKKEMNKKVLKQAYLQQMKRLNPKVFSYLNDKYLLDFYNTSEPELWNGYLLLAIDGSKAEVPNSQENKYTFGISGNHHPKSGQIRALISGMYDILNGFYLDLQIANISNSESELAKENLKHLEMLEINKPVLSIFDRGYPSLEFIDFLEKKGIHYLFRLSSNDYKEERKNMKSCDEFVSIKHNYARLAKINKNHPESYEHMKEKENTTVRILKSNLPSGQELTLMTDLPKKFTLSEIIDLYYQRWEIEKKYNTLKNKMKFESITGKASVYVYQDFYAQILVYNMIQDIRRNADYNVEIAGHQKKMKYSIYTNENIAIGLFKEAMIKILLEENPDIKSKQLSVLQAEMEKYILPRRELPGNERRKNISNK